MPLICAKCRRTNPAEATYCYFDGALLPGHGNNGGPVRAGTQAFPREFIFASGRACRNFDEFCLACTQERAEAIRLLQGGYLESFLAGIGRADLAAVARQAAQFPDRHRGLDMLLEKLPSQVVDPPRLQVEPLAINLGQVAIGDDRRFDLHIVNQGMRLLYGTIIVEETPWLALGDEAIPEKSFDCEHELDVPVLIKGKKLKAHRSQQQGKVLVESNGGTAEVLVRIEVPITPFPTGVLAGARSQRQLAEQAFKQPKESSPLFESGAVARWYADNGWQYPVQGPTASGVAALQQFLEACGLTTAPKVELETPAVKLASAYGQRVEGRVRLKAVEKKPIFAYAVSDQAWLIPRPAVLAGTQATIPIEVPNVPFTIDGAPLEAKLTVVSNGRKKFIVPVTLEIVSLAAPVAKLATETAAPAGTTQPVQLFDDSEPEPAGPVTAPDRSRDLFHLLPAVLLMIILLGLVLFDCVQPKPTRPEPDLDVSGLPAPAEPLDDTPYLTIQFSSLYPHRFGISVPQDGRSAKKLTFAHDGWSNNTCVRIDGQEFLLDREGRPAPGQRNARRPDERQPGRLWVSTLDMPADSGIRVTQTVSLRHSDQSGKLETCLVRYAIENLSSQRHSVGLRFMLDTFIGENDGVPFTIPGRGGLCDTMQELKKADEVPEFIQALEKENIKDPGTIAHLTLKIQDQAGKLEPPSRVLLGAWPNQNLNKEGALSQNTRWHVPAAPMKTLTPHDSAVVIYWDEKDLAPGQTREMAFAYGLGMVSSTGAGAGKLALTVDGTFRPGGTLAATAYVSQPAPGQRARLTLPPGLRFAEGETEERPVPLSPTGSYSPVTWKLHAERQGEFVIKVESGGVSQSQTIRIRAKSFLD